MKKVILVSTVSMAIFSCAHHRDVRPGPNNLHQVVVQGEDTHAGSRDAIAQANHFCKQQGKYAAFVEEKQEYTGDMDEDTYKNAKRASKAAQILGGSARVFGDKKTSRVGGIAAVGGATADSVIGDGYTVKM